MASTIRFPFVLDDGMSGPARKIEKALDAVESKLEKADGALNAVASSSRKVEQALDGVRTRVEATRRAFDQFDKELYRPRKTPAWMDDLLAKQEARARSAAKRVARASVIVAPDSPSPNGGGSWMDGLLGLGTTLAPIAAAGYAVGALASKLTELGVAFGGAAIGASRFAIEQASFKKSTIASLSILTGSESEAKGLFNYMGRLADLTPFDDRQVIDNFRALLGSGLNKSEATSVFAALSDIETASGKKGSGEAILNQLTQALGKGKFDLEDLKVVASQSGGLINIGKVFERAAKLSGKSAAQVRAAGLDARTGIRALMESVRDDIGGGGPLGTLTTALAESRLDTQLSTLSSNFGRLFQDIDFSPFVNALKNVNALLEQDANGKYLNATAQRLHDVMTSLFDNSFKALFGQYEGADGMKRMQADFEHLVSIVEKLAKALETVASVAGKAFGVARTVAFGADATTTKGESVAASLITGFATGIPLVVPAIGGAIDIAQRLAAPAMADGGIVTGPTLALIGEAGPEAVVPLRSTGAGAGLGQLGMRAEVHLTVNAHGDGSPDSAHRIAREVREALPSMLQDAFERMAAQAAA